MYVGSRYGSFFVNGCVSHVNLLCILSPGSEVSSVTTRLSSTQGEGIWEYVFSLPYNFTEVRSIRGKQARLTLWESLELFDICNDFVFILRVAAYMRHIKGYGSQTEINKLPIGYVSLAWLICIYMISLVAYFTRRWWLYHRISPKGQSINSRLWISLKQILNTSCPSYHWSKSDKLAFRHGHRSPPYSCSSG
eukprot:Protomagalhaensia_wolfi_Nauph_80__1949@NODE_222_length_3145_cov_85_101739_g133_i5_p2_GENE_NODE_222_length_3145_cov_85_101739_g133_i5NODE_222_length_3145_cov_85_101739_g133_i5_p2_ORF_typecomplete_len193_score1_16_NODE_222_length_3145_cov_85_101739_g133_i525313109